MLCSESQVSYWQLLFSRSRLLPMAIESVFRGATWSHLFLPSEEHLTFLNALSSVESFCRWFGFKRRFFFCCCLGHILDAFYDWCRRKKKHMCCLLASLNLDRRTHGAVLIAQSSFADFYFIPLNTTELYVRSTPKHHFFQWETHLIMWPYFYIFFLKLHFYKIK